MTSHFISFATTPSVRSHYKHIEEAGKRIIQQAKDIGAFDSAYLYNEHDLKNDEDFWSKNGRFCEQNSKGYGFYIWKPYIIKHKMDGLKNGDILLYLDAGCEIDPSKPENMQKLIEKTKNCKIVGAGTGLAEGRWTKKDLLLKLNMYERKYIDTIQYQGGTNMFLVCDETRKLVNEWYELACEHSNIDNTHSTSDIQDLMIVENHRHDQSIFSLLAKKYDIYCYGIIESGCIVVKRNRTGKSQLH